MRKIYLGFVFALLTTVFSVSNVRAQNTIMYSCAVFTDSIWGVDTLNQTITERVGVTLAGQTLEGLNDMVYDPIGHKTYVIARILGVTPRMLCTVDLKTGVLTQVGSLGDKFSGLTFLSNGQLMGVTGDGATTSETLYTIDKTTGVATLAIALGNGADGEMIAYNKDDGMIYHWSGNGTIVFEKFPALPPYTPVTNIPITGVTSGETFGALYIGNNDFLLSNINSQVYHMSSTGLIANTVFLLPNNVRSVVIPPQFFVEDTICLGDTLFADFGGMSNDTVIYSWGDGTSDVVFPTGGASHVYSSNGNFTLRILLKNATQTDTVETIAIRVNALPGVTLTPGGNTPVCDTTAISLTGSSGGSSQWYMNGAPILGATSNTYSANMPGVYNMIKTNQNGCEDSASVSVVLSFGSTPVFDLGADTVGCAGIPICFTVNTGTSYLWSDSSTANNLCVSTSGMVGVTVFDAAGCSAEDSVNVSIIPTPNPAPTADTSACPTVVFAGNDANSSTWSWDFGDGGSATTANPTYTYATNGTYTVSAMGTNQCGTVSTSVTVVISCLIAIENGFADALKVSPNPSNGTFALHLVLDEASGLKYSVSDIQGRSILEKSFDNAQMTWNEQLNLNVEAGIYFLKVEAAGKSASFKLLIQ